MIFTQKNWEKFCKKISDENLISIPLKECFNKPITERIVCLKHDVETNVFKAFKIAEIESKYGHRGSYYVQAYLLNNESNIKLLTKMQDMGHEVTYHHDVMDSNNGDINKAFDEFNSNLELFEINGFNIVTVCQHGNPVIERTGYTSNRDFFRNENIQQRFEKISDVMVNFPAKARITYDYYSDAGRKFKLIYDPINNDIINSDQKNISYENLDELISEVVNKRNNFIISIHPHRWTKTAIESIIKDKAFRIIKVLANGSMKISFIKRIAGKYYYLAKKI